MKYKLLICGEALGREEEEAGQPFVGASGKLLKRLLSQVGINWKEAYLTNVFQLRPRPSNDITNLCGPKPEGIPHLKPLAPGKYVRKEFKPELDRLWQEVETIQPNLILALGNTAIWALCEGHPKISKSRGAIMQSHRGPKLIATYHPAAMLRQWSLKPIILADLEKAAKQMEFPELTRPSRDIWIEPSLSDLDEFERRFLETSDQISIDLENPSGVFTCIGFAPSPHTALVVPFYDADAPGGSYWRTPADERAAWAWVARQCARPRAIYVGQNFMYDAHVLFRELGIPTAHNHDTMLLHHSMQPELEKGLGFLGSCYTDEPAWKLMRTKKSRKKEDN